MLPTINRVCKYTQILIQTVENEILRPNGICRDTIYPKTIDTTSLKQWLDDLNL